MTAPPSGRVRVRPAAARDLPHIHEIEMASFPDPWSLEGFRDLVGNPLAQLDVAEDPSGALLGYAASWHVADESEIVNLAVRHGARRHGVGATLLDHILEMAAASGARSVFLEVRESNEAGRRLYESRAFAVAGRRAKYYSRPDEDALIMKRSL